MRDAKFYADSGLFLIALITQKTCRNMFSLRKLLQRNLMALAHKIFDVLAMASMVLVTMTLLLWIDFLRWMRRGTAV